MNIGGSSGIYIVQLQSDRSISGCHVQNAVGAEVGPSKLCDLLCRLVGHVDHNSIPYFIGHPTVIHYLLTSLGHLIHSTAVSHALVRVWTNSDL